MASFFIRADEKGPLGLAGSLEKITSESPNLGSKIRHPTQSRENYVTEFKSWIQKYVRIVIKTMCCTARGLTIDLLV